ncbi:hypothetical protein [Flammeovirga sp. SJP92]|uniref:hypothetical protein n=1 Tax=Flammeovirga sp. SJP92 TaxID=1775430 RepID=UPI00078920F1|nr:hypothetical protein [Flammeovirga sp. SJP92]KXX69425.1 hypothetical protein AVL50_19290 [Flammeovirga sp. SJP92]
MKERLIILSDLWGKEKADWFIYYTKILETKFDITFYDSGDLGEIDKTNYEQEALHLQFLNGGIDKAVDNLIGLEKKPVKVLAFSIGGVIAWKYGLQTHNLKSLTCISSSRLRKESQKPQGKIHLYFGQEDLHIPAPDWLHKMGVPSQILKGKSHEMYREEQFAKVVSNSLILM